jgi:hypothetical protein
MTSREQTLAFVLLGAILLTVGGAGGYMFIWQPLQKQREQEAALNKEIDDLEAQLRAQKDTTQRLALARTRSLPADEALARREYTVALTRLLDSANVPKGYTITPKAVDNSARSVPEISKGKPIYTRVAYEVTFKKADMWAVRDFLEGYYNLGLLHQITAINIKKDDDASAKSAGRRNDLTVTLTTEAILVEGAENRRTLLPVPTAFAGIGGGALYKAMTVSPEAGRGVTPLLHAHVLANHHKPNHRDYSLMVQKDPFNGPLPPLPKFKLDKISDVKIKTDEKPSPVKVALSGDGSVGAKVTALASGSLFAEGALKVDPKTYAIELPKTSATEGTATISVIATSADGKATEKGSFKVSLADPPKVVEGPKIDLEDIASYIVLIGVAPRSDGTAWARIVDNANRTRYQIDATRTGIKVVKEEITIPRKGWQPDPDHVHPAGVMNISAEKSKTNRLFKIIAVDADGLILADLKPDGSAPAAKPAGKWPNWPPPGKGAVVKQGPGNPLAALGGNMIVAAPPPKYYRWAVGNSLAGLKLIPDDEAKKILKRAEATGPVFDAVTIAP